MMATQRILIFGPSGAGKSTLARTIGRRLGISVVHLDALYWAPGWVEVDTEVFRERIAEQVADAAWVIDGNYSKHLDLRLPRAQAAVWLDLPRYIYFPRAVWRSIRNYGRYRSDVGNHEQFELAFFREWVWTYPRRARIRQGALMANLPPGVHGIVLTSCREVKRFIEGLPGSLCVDEMFTQNCPENPPSAKSRRL